MGIVLTWYDSWNIALANRKPQAQGLAQTNRQFVLFTFSLTRC